MFEQCYYDKINKLIMISVAYLLVFHIIFTLFTWSYIKTIITPPQIPSKQVKAIHNLSILNILVNCYNDIIQF